MQWNLHDIKIVKIIVKYGIVTKMCRNKSISVVQTNFGKKIMSCQDQNLKLFHQNNALVAVYIVVLECMPSNDNKIVIKVIHTRLANAPAIEEERQHIVYIGVIIKSS